MNITEIETAIIDRLKEQIEDVQIEAYPDKPAEYKLIHPRGALLVRYNSSQYTESNVIGYVSQIRTIFFEIAAVMRHLRHEGIYDYLEDVRLALTGYRPSALCDKLEPVSEEFVSEENNIWMYSMLFKTAIINKEGI